jgi:hypothetical protein
MPWLSAMVARVEPIASPPRGCSLCARTSALGRAHEFTRARFFNGLSAHSRNFFRAFGRARNVVPRGREAASKACPVLAEGNAPATEALSLSDYPSNPRTVIRAAYRSDRPCFVWRSTSQKRRKRKVSFRRTKPNVSQECRKSLTCLKALNQRFRGIVCFQWVDAHFVSPFSSPALFSIEKPNPARAERPIFIQRPLVTRERSRKSGRHLRRFRIAGNGDAVRAS